MNTLKTTKLADRLRAISLAAGLTTALALPAWSLPALPDANDSADPQIALRDQWQKLMAQNPTPDEGCFHASYPDTTWQKVECTVGQPRVHPEHRQLAADEPEVTGDGNDYIIQATGLITLAGGSFATKGVKSEDSVGVASFGGGGILGADEYSVQLNTNMGDTTDACDKHSGCTVWQQFVYARDYIKQGTAAVFMQYWLINWGSSACPSGWGHYHADCFKNSELSPAPDIAIADLGKISLTATARAGGEDSVILTYDNEQYVATGKDSVLDISSVWNKAEFNVLGDAGGSRADFNSGSSVTVTVLALDGSTATPKCVANEGTTGETNNLNLGTCKASGGIPNIQFTESN